MEAHPLRRYSKRVNVASGMRLPSRDRGKRDQSDSGVWQSNRRALGAAALTAGRSATRLDRTPKGTWQRRLHGQTARDSRTQAGPNAHSSSGTGGWWWPPSILPVTFRIKCVISSNNRSSNNRSGSTRSPWGSTTNLELARLTQAQLLVVLLMQRSVAACCGCCSSDTYTPD